MEQKHRFTEIKGHADKIMTSNPTNSSKMTSMNNLITWNILKAIEKNPDIDTKTALQSVEERLVRAPIEINEIITRFPEQRHIACAFLAWKELGHKHADSLHEFFVRHQKEEKEKVDAAKLLRDSDIESFKPFDYFKRDQYYEKIADCARENNSYKVGPVVKIPTVMNSKMAANNSLCRELPMNVKPFRCSNCLYENMRRPVETIIMRLDTDPGGGGPKQPPKKTPLDKDLMQMIDEACCQDLGCVEKLVSLDKAVKELRSRANQLGRREAERAELLERAEAAWKDLELGYQRRLKRAVETEDDLIRQIHDLITERNGYKTVCTSLANQLRVRGGAAEAIREQLSTIEKQVCHRACTRLKLNEEAARADATLAHQQCLATQLDRDQQFKEQQARRKLAALESDLESSMALTNEVERAMRTELGGQREHMAQISTDLLAEDAKTEALKEELKKLQTLKNEMLEDLGGCREVCDKKIQSKIEELASKRKKLENLREQTIECRCKEPKDFCVEVKRTPSLAALCQCNPEEKFLVSPVCSATLTTDKNKDSCSCTSLRTSLLTNLLSDLFGGLSSELPETGITMPCQMLKCLEDKHKWDSPTNIKTNLRNFFSKLLVGELKIAIVTSIEKHHARWVGASCADTVKRSIPDFDPYVGENWQQKALERRAQQIAEKLAEKMFKERADALMQQAKDVVEAGPPPCTCDNDKDKNKEGTANPLQCSCNMPPALFPCLVDVQLKSSHNKPILKQIPVNLKQINDAQNYSTPVKKETRITFNKPAAGSSRPAANNHRHNTIVNRSSDMTYHKVTGNRDMDINTPERLRQTINDLSLMRTEISIIKKESIKKNDLKIMEKNIAKLIQQSTTTDDLDYSPCAYSTSYRKRTKNSQLSNMSDTPAIITVPKQVHFSKRKGVDTHMVCSRSTGADKHKEKFDRRPCQSFAVNLCLCGATKAPKNILHPNKLTSQKQKEFIKETKSITEIKMKPSKDTEYPDRNFCKSDCHCFEKAPSNNSLNMFFDTLAKRNSTLINSNEKHKWDVKKQSNQVLSSYDTFDGNKKYPSENNSSEPKLKTKNETVEISNEFKNLNTNHEAEHHHPICTAVESEYMGAVNLEKSVDTFCGCTIAKEIKKCQGRYLSNIISSNFPIECLNSCNCCTKYLEQKSDYRSFLFGKSHIKYNVSSQFDAKSEKQSQTIPIGDSQKSVTDKKYNVKPNNDRGRGENVAKQYGNREYKSNKDAPECDDYNFVKKIEIFPGDCDYQIKFLGVTLTDENTKILEEPIYYKKQNYKYFNHSGRDVPPPHTTSMKKQEYWTGVTHTDTAGLPIKHTYINHEIPSANKQLPSCQCNVNCADLKKTIYNVLNKQTGDFITKDDKEVDTNSLKKTKDDNSEPCVCCDNNSMPESQELETNTFHLIEEHLRKRFKIFKGNCNSSCLPDDEEGKFYFNVLQKIKQIISESTNAVVCECRENQEGQESWKRAQQLLQEYLKLKIDRAQCACASSVPDLESVVPDVTEKVCYLIENDFKRLKKFCDCKNRNVLCNEKQTKLKKNKILQTLLDSTTVEFENKSIDAMRKLFIDEILQTPEKQLEMKDQCSNYSNNLNKTSFACMIKLDENDSTDLIPCKIERLRSKSDEMKPNVMKFDESCCCDKKSLSCRKMSLPFIGCTLECTCSRTSSQCTCTKAIVKKNHSVMNDIWKSYKNRKNDDKITSYIMDNVKKIKDPYLCSMHRLCVRNEDRKFCDFESFADCEEDIILKECDQSLNHEDQGTNTFYEEALNKKQYPSKGDPHVWYACGSISEHHNINWRLDHNTNVIDMNDMRNKSETVMLSAETLTDRDCGSCGCETVPICHVKMLIQDIEQKLSRSQCVCDSMHSEVCPIHSRKSI